MQDFGTLRQPLLGELAGRKKEEREENDIYSRHLRFCLQPKGSACTPLEPIFGKWKTNILSFGLSHLGLLHIPKILSSPQDQEKQLG